MKPFNNNSDDNKKITPNENEIKSIISDSIKRFKIFYSQKDIPEMTKFVFENIYDSIRELSECICLRDGLKIYSHELTISYLYKIKLLSEPEASFFDDLRILRNKSKYYGENISEDKLDECIEDVKRIFEKLLNVLNN